MKIFLFLAFMLLTKFAVCQQREAITFEIPTEFKESYNTDKIKFQEYIKPIGEATGKAYQLWEHANMGKWKDYNFDSVYSIYLSLKKKQYYDIIEYIKNNSNSYFSMYIFEQRLLNSFYLQPDSLYSIYSLLNNNLKTTSYGKYIDEKLKRRSSVVLNKKMPIFSFKTDKGEHFDLTQFRNEKYVLICFWASWCGPCIKNIPSLKKIHETFYTKGLQLVSISIDQNREKWLEAVYKYSMPWPQTCDLPDYVKNNILRYLLEITLIPQYFLIDKEGNLVYHNFQMNDDDDYSILNNILSTYLK